MNGKIIVITSVIQGNGAKYVATNLAFETQRKFQDNKVLLIDFDFENPFLAYEYVKHDRVHGIDNIINNISGEGLTKELFEENIIHTSIKLDVLKGTNFPDKFKMFTKEAIEIILKYSKEIYDYIFVVVGNKSNNAGTVYSLFSADFVVLVIKNNYSNMLRIEKSVKMVSQYLSGTQPLMIVHNYKNMNSKAVINSTLVGSNADIAGILEYDEKSIDNLDLDKRMSMFGSKGINYREFLQIVDCITK